MHILPYIRAHERVKEAHISNGSIIIFRTKARLSIFPVCSEEFFHSHGKIFPEIFYRGSVDDYIALVPFSCVGNAIPIFMQVRHSDRLAPHRLMYAVYIIVAIELGNSRGLEVGIWNRLKKCIEHLEDSKKIGIFFQKSHR